MHETKPIMSGRADPPGLAVLAPKLRTYGSPGGPGGGASVAITSSLKTAHRIARLPDLPEADFFVPEP